VTSEELLFELAPRADTRSAGDGRPPRPWRPLLLLLPAAVLVGVLLVLPLVTTIVVSLAGWGAHYREIADDSGVRHAIRNSVWWLAFAPLVCLGGLGLARLARGGRRGHAFLIGVFAAPVAASALISGIAFRLIFDPRPARGTVSALIGTVSDVEIPFLGSGWLWVVLASAFAWQWIGLAAVVFRAGLGEIPRDLLRVARTFGAGPIRRLTSVVIPALFPVGALVLVIVLVGTARIFDMVVITAPGSMQDRFDVVGLHWWRWQSDLGDGAAAALAVLMFLIVGGAALACLWGLSREWPGGGRPADPAPKAMRNANAAPTPGAASAASAAAAWRRWPARLLAALAVVFWAMPLLVLVLTSAHNPRAAAGSGWWHGAFGLDSYRQAFASGELASALVSTGGRALAAAIVLVLVAAPAAYALAWGGMSRLTVRVLIGLTAVLAVVPPQAVILPLGNVFHRLHLLGAPTSLVMVHAAFGTPLAVLLLRNAFALVPRDVVRTRQLEPEPASALLAVAALSWPAVLTVAVLEFVLVWNDFIVGLLLGGSEAHQIMLVLFQESRQFTTSSGVLAAGSVVSLVIPLAIVLATGKWLVRGLTEGVTR
jgi:alpha-glucoside transport system permease protein